MPRKETDVDAQLADAVALLASGLPPQVAWAEAGIGLDDNGMPELAGTQAGTVAAVRAAATLARDCGVPLAAVLKRVLEVERDREEARDACEAALAGPKMSARVLAWLPLAGVGLAALLDPRAIDVLVSTPIGWVLLALAAILTWCGRRWTRALLGAATPDSEDVPPALALALVEAALSSGMDVPGAVRAVGGVVDGVEGDAMVRAGASLSTGAAWDEAWDRPAQRTRRWRPLRPGSVARGPGQSLCGQVERALRAPHRCGASAVPALRSATEGALRRSRRDAQQAAGQLGVTLSLPLTMCLLPAFILVGIVPMVLAVLASVSLPQLPGEA
ncbi:hypothetical protein [Demequina flava]|uniref:hypothetical protein n=1 Tax=Demequina flava TaxID=1095025 RepID=UPI0007801D07|nr:hypothetical protein [Demequina flava]